MQALRLQGSPWHSEGECWKVGAGTPPIILLLKAPKIPYSFGTQEMTQRDASIASRGSLQQSGIYPPARPTHRISVRRTSRVTNHVLTSPDPRGGTKEEPGRLMPGVRPYTA